MKKTGEELGFALGAMAIECANAAVTFCFEFKHREIAYDILQEKTKAYLTAVHAFEEWRKHVEREAQAQEVQQSRSSDVPPDGADT